MSGKQQSFGGYAAAVIASAGVALATTLAMPAHAESLTAFNEDRVLTPAELDQLRGGFFMADGAFIRFGFQTQQYLNGMLLNDVKVNPITLAQGVVKPSLTVTHTTYMNGNPTTVTEPLSPNGFNFPVTANNGQTTLSIATTNGSVQSVIQNATNNQTLQSVTSIDVTTQGVLPSVQNLYATAQVANAIQANVWLRR